MSQSGTPLPEPVLLSDWLPTAQQDPKRAHAVQLKQRLAGLLGPEEGEEYWIGLMEFVSGKINRDELSLIIARILEPVEGAGQ